MAATIIDGKVLSTQVLQQVKAQVELFTKEFRRSPGLAVVLVGSDSASQIYVKNKRSRCQEVGITSFAHDLAVTTTEPELLALIGQLNLDPAIDGILVQLPLPRQIDSKKVIEAIHPDKDVDGFHPYNLGQLVAGYPRLVSCTPAGIMTMIHSTGVKIPGKRAVVVGRSNIVGKPTAMLLLQEHATVTICHSQTELLAAECRAADILVVAVGKKLCILGDYIKPGAIVIDVGMNRDETGLCGDVDFERAKERAAFITPVPGGVGLMTTAMLMKNTVQAAYFREGRKS